MNERTNHSRGAAIETRSLTKVYDGERVVDGLDWTVPRGAACAFLGPNAAGKSTTLRMLMGFTHPTAGTCRVLGEDPWDLRPATRARVGYVAEQPLLPPWIRVGALVDFHRSLYPAWSTKLERELLELFELPLAKKVSQLSKGQHRRLMLTLALAQAPDLLILDEPGAGLDVAARRQLLSLLADYLAGEGKTLVLSTHIVTDVERIASHVAVIAHGRMVAHTELDELHENVKQVRMPRAFWDRTVARWEAAGILAADVGEHAVTLTVRHFHTHGRFVLAELSEGEVHAQHGPHEDLYLGENGAEAQVLHLGLEDAFLALSTPDARASAEAGS